MNFDAPGFSLSEVGELLGTTDLKRLHNWTDLQLVDPHTAKDLRRRGRGRERLYSVRDVARFALMADLSARYAIPVSLGRRICENVLGDFNPKNPGIFVVANVSPDEITTHWCANFGGIARWVSRRGGCSVLLVNAFSLLDVWDRAASAFEAKSDGRAHE